MDSRAASETPQRPVPWGPLAAVLGTLGIYFAAQLAAGLILAVFALIIGWDGAQISRFLQDSLTGQFALVVIIEVITLGLLYTFLQSRRASLSDLGLRRPKLSDMGYAVAGFAAYLPLYILVVQFLSGILPSLNVEQEQQLAFNTATVGPGLLLVFVSLVILPPIVEEILARGFLYGGLRRNLPKLSAALITSLIFAVAHLQFWSGQPLLWIAAVDTFVLSMVLVYLREKSDGLWAPIGLHMIKNGIAFAVLFIFKVT